MSCKTIFVKNRLVDYIIPWLDLVASKENLELVLTRDTKDFKTKFKYTKLSHFKLFNKIGISFPLISKLLFDDYDIAVSSDPHTIDTYLTFFISKLRGKKYILWNETFEWPRSPKSKILDPLVNLTIRKADATLAVGKKSKEYLIKRKAKKIFLTPYTTIKYPIKKFKINLPNKPIVLYFSRLVRYKGIKYLLEACSQLDVYLIIAGDGPYKSEVEKLIKKLNVKCLFLNKTITPEEKGYLYSLANVFVLPSTFTDYDADCWGLVMNEAMSYSKPVISTDTTGSAHDLIKQGVNGYMVPQKNSEELYKALKKILSDEKLQTSMGKESKKIIDNNHTFDKMAQGFLDAITFCKQQ